ncbi:bifunctional phosphopantothenoylcysteine decarboxylase/phosphopantothenate--cysteine ligase CoaBC [Granulicella cerasi]|uniref:Coenzyme A biosynthesis bifunctional protein CoaBC n=1 Tax=Granulicella cerasi TaxID=741063 RepID=A0ABW1Z9V9_9BACT|nr:bifunctional phosphopantothenoylcysteine decarboxylase/phosphopantothenate--cysteine ligase CoaBC [Granulicella cerasi]
MRVLLAVTGGIAAYKSAELARTLQKQGIDVEVAMTASAERFITPLTFSSLTGNRVHTSLWDSSEEDTQAIEHIAVMQRCNAMLVVPATANTLAKFAHGIADDFITATYLANTKPVLVAPAMNVNMWNHAATQANLQTLAQRGVQIIAPDAGYLACGMVGEGRLASLETIVEATLHTLVPRHDLAGESILITAGGTREPLDAVRFLGNRSSGRMGHAVAEAAAQRGAHVILITASSLAIAANIETVRVNTAAEMHQAVLASLPRASMVVKSAAVADFRPMRTTQGKLKRNGPLMLELEPTEDIAAEIVRLRAPHTLVLAFAAEADNLEANALGKLHRKGVDAIFANNVTEAGIGFDAEQNAGLLITRDETTNLARMSKRALADRLLDALLELRIRKTASQLVNESAV